MVCSKSLDASFQNLYQLNHYVKIFILCEVICPYVPVFNTFFCPHNPVRDAFHRNGLCRQ